MTIQLYNTRTRKKEEFKPLDENNVRMYVCGPTVYDRAHIGNARAVVVFDVLYRLLRHEYGEEHVKYIRNITDVDDKIIAAANERGISIEALTKETIEFFEKDMEALNCLKPTEEPKATAHIKQMVEMIQKLIDSKHAYAAEGHVLFAVESYENYGSLSRRSRDEMIAGARVEVAPYKKNAGDFVLWKPAKDGEQSFDSPWGKGRPGWHIECSAMSIEYLGDTFDIHGGGADLMFPHHENEIAQSVCSNPNSEFAKFWVHNGFLTVNGEKMSKSLGNFITVKDLLSDIRTNHPAAIRYALLATHYSKPLDWNQKSFEDAKNSILRFTEALNTLMTKTAFGKTADGVWGSALLSIIPAEPSKVFMEALRDDMNTPKAFAELHALCKEINKAENTAELEKYGRVFIGCLDRVGLMSNSISFFPNKPMEETLPPEEVRNLDIKRKEAKKAKNFQEADKIREEIKALGYTPIDKPNGTTEWRKA